MGPGAIATGVLSDVGAFEVQAEAFAHPDRFAPINRSCCVAIQHLNESLQPHRHGRPPVGRLLHQISSLGNSDGAPP
jgi:hypothetical protein